MILSTMLCGVLLFSATSAVEDTSFESDSLKLTIDASGHVVSLVDKAKAVDYANADPVSPLLQVRTDGKLTAPDRMEWNADEQQLRLHFGAVQAVIQTEIKPTHINFELISLEPLAAVDRIQWGPIATKLNGTVGETIGVVRDDAFAIGLQILNVKTLGGPIENEEPQTVTRGTTAQATDGVSTLQAYSLDRSRPRNITVWGEHYRNMPVPPIPGETVVGSKIALFGCPADQALARVGEIGKSEGLPHPEFDGTWSRMNPQMRRPYLIVEFNENNIEEVLQFAKRGNFLSVYHPQPFQSWGHYQLSGDHFPNGEAGMKACVEQAKQLGMHIGVHTLTNFINTNDAYITPVPDPRLAKTGSSQLVGEIDARQTDIEVVAPEYFANHAANWLRTVMIDGELIRYGRMSEAAPWKLLDCQRGAWGTTAASHPAGAEVGKLMDHPYQVFFPNFEMQHEIAQRLAELFNETGISHLDFDGHEGCLATGQGTYAMEMFSKVFFDQLKQPVLNGSSQILPYYWRINTNSNWGEPWYGGFRLSMADYRIENQALFRRNFMPNMMGWFSLTPETTLADIEWLMARTAGYNAGFALTAELGILRGNRHTPEILDAIRNWEAVCMAGAFTPHQQERLRDSAQEFTLIPADGGAFLLYPYETSKSFTHERIIRQPGEPTRAQWEFDGAREKQPLQFSLQVQGEAGQMESAVLEVNNYLRLEIPVVVKHGQTLVCDGSKTLRIYSAEGRQVGKSELAQLPPEIPPGRLTVAFDCKFVGEPAPVVQVQFKVRGPAERIVVAQ